MREKKYDKLKGFSTTIPAERSINNIERMLAVAGAMKILKEYDAGSNVLSLAFMIKTDKGIIPFKLPLDPIKVRSAFNELVKQGRLPKKYHNNINQARRVGWRIIHDWLEAQLSLIRIQVATLDQIFLSYAQDPSGQTFYEAIQDRIGKLALPETKTSIGEPPKEAEA